MALTLAQTDDQFGRSRLQQTRHEHTQDYNRPVETRISLAVGLLHGKQNLEQGVGEFLLGLLRVLQQDQLESTSWLFERSSALRFGTQTTQSWPSRDAGWIWIVQVDTAHSDLAIATIFK